MTTETAIHILELYNKWRRADEDMEMPDPKQLGLAIDCAIEELNKANKAVKLAKQTKDKLIEWQGPSDTEIAHGKADELLCAFVNDLGFTEVAKSFEKIEKWYA